MIYFLLISLLILFIISFFINEENIIAPGVVFSFGFLVQAIIAVIYAKRWELGLHLNTYLALTLGIAEFIIVSFIVHLIYNYIRNKKANKKGIGVHGSNKQLQEISAKIKFIKVNKLLEILYLIFMLIVSGIYLYFVVKRVNGSFDSISSIFAAMFKFDNFSKFSDEPISLPFLITNLQKLVVVSGYWFIYVVINNYSCNKKINIVEILIIIVSLASSLLCGSRTESFMIIFSAVTIFIILIQKKKNKNNVLTLKLIRNIVIVGCVFLAIFYFSAQIWGRVSKNDKVYYFAIYCGAQVKNLDIFLQEKNAYVKKSSLWGSQTFYSIIQTLGKKIGFNGFEDYKLDLPFRSVNNLDLGNVYTTFYPYIYDFGYIGEFILVLIMAIISQVVFEFTKDTKTKECPSLSILTYSNIVNCLILSFFSNKFYENIISISMLKNIVFWWLFSLFLCKINYKETFKKVKKIIIDKLTINCQ